MHVRLGVRVYIYVRMCVHEEEAFCCLPVTVER